MQHDYTLSATPASTIPLICAFVKSQNLESKRGHGRVDCLRTATANKIGDGELLRQFASALNLRELVSKEL
jgi:hypothetical protein